MKKAIKEEAEKCGDSGPNKMAAQMVITVNMLHPISRFDVDDSEQHSLRLFEYADLAPPLERQGLGPKKGPARLLMLIADALQRCADSYIRKKIPRFSNSHTHRYVSPNQTSIWPNPKGHDESTGQSDCTKGPTK
jgi:hypothetical protein